MHLWAKTPVGTSEPTPTDPWCWRTGQSICFGNANQKRYASGNMLYKFKSKAAGDLIMLEDSGRAILTIIGKGDPQTLKQGIVQPPEMPAAIAALQQAVVEEDARMQLKVDAARDTGRSLASGGPAISLRQRSLPFIRMLERCHAQNKEIVWGV